MAYDGFYLTYKSDRETNERFDRVRQKYPNFRMVKINLEDWSDPKIDKAIMKIADVTNTKHFWIVDPDVEVQDDFDFDFQTDSWDDNVVHVWNAEERNVFRSVVGVKLFKTSDVKKNSEQYIQSAYFLTGEFKEHTSNQVEYKPTTETYDIFYWKKDYGNANFEKLKERFPEIKTVEGDTNVSVHETCRKLARTDFYYLVHPNTEIFDTFNFDYSFAFGLDKENQKVVVWQKENPTTGFVREYHGVGLFPKDGPMFKEREYSIFNFRRKAVYEKAPIARDLEFPVVRTTDMHKLNHTVDADMYWLVHEDVEEFTAEFYPFSYDREFIHNFQVKTANGKTVRNGIRLVPKNADIEKQKDIEEVVGKLKSPKVISASTLKSGIEQCEGYPALIVDPAVELNADFDFYPDLYDLASAHIFNRGVVFAASEYDEYNVKFHDDVVSYIPQYDVFVYDSGNNTENVKQYKNYTILSGDIVEAHKQAQEKSKFNYYYFITDDVDVSNFGFDYEFEFSMTEASRQQIVVWQKTDLENNPLEYKGVGLFRKQIDTFSETKYKNYDFRRRALYVQTNDVKPITYPVVSSIDNVNTCGYEMAWVVDECVENFSPDFVPPSYDKEYIHNFNVITHTGAIARNHVRLVPVNWDEEKQKDIDKVLGKVKEYNIISSSTLKDGLSQIDSYPALIVDPAVELDNFSFYPDLYDLASVHIFNRGVVFVASEYDEYNVKFHDDVVSHVPQYDVFVYDSGNNTENVKQYTDYTILSGDIVEAHKTAQEKSKSNYYYFITDDVDVSKFGFDYEFEFSMTEASRQQIVVWQKSDWENNALEYKGVGLFRKQIDTFSETKYKNYDFRRRALYVQTNDVKPITYPIVNKIADVKSCGYEMAWVVDECVENFSPNFIPPSYDKEYIHNFKVTTQTGAVARNHVRLVPVNWDEEKQKDIDKVMGTVKDFDVIYSSTLKGGIEQVKKYPSLIIDPAVEITNFNFYPDLYDEASAHIFDKGVVLLTKEYDEYNVKFHDDVVSRVPQYDVFVYDTGNNTENVKQYTDYKILSGDIVEAHKTAQEQSRYNYYYFITDDVDVSNFGFDYEFEFSMTEEGRQQIVVWQKTDLENNPLEYKGVGLFRKQIDTFGETKYKNYDFRRRALYVQTNDVKPITYPTVRKLSDVKSCGYEMAWVVDDCVENFSPDFVPPSYDKEFIHNFNVITHTSAIARNHVRLVPVNWDEEKQKDIDKVMGKVKDFDVVLSSTLRGGIEQVKSYPTLIVDPAVELLDFNFYPDLYDEASAHVFDNGVVLLTKEYDEYNIKLHEDTVATVPEYNIFFWDRGFGKNNFADLQKRFPRIQNVTTDTLTELHELAQQKSTYNYYYVITSDTTVTDFNFDYEFEFSMTEANRQQIVVWQKSDWENNALEYHGVGLFRKDYDLFEERKYQRFDFRRKALYQHTTNIKPVKYDIVYTDDLKNLSQVKKCDTEMVWLVDKNVYDEVTDYVPPSYDKSYIHNFQVEIDNGTAVRNGIRLVPINYDEEKQKDIEQVLGNMGSFDIVYSSTLKSGLEQIKEYPAWIVDPALELNEDFSFYPDLFDEASAYIFNPGGVVFVAKDYDEFNVKFIEEEVATYPDYDIFYWDKGFGNANFTELQERFPRIQRVSTTHALELHNYARDNSTHNYYYIVTPDTKVGDFNFDYKFEFSMTEEGRQQIVVWQRSDTDGELREYYGVGLFRKDYEKFDEKQYAKFNFRRRALYIETKELTDVPFDVIRVSDLLDTTQAVGADTEMAWLVSNNVEFTQPEFSPFSYDRHYTHNFNITVGDATIRNGVRLVPRIDASEESQKDIDMIAGSLQPVERVEARTVAEAVELATQDVFWMVNPDLELTDKTVDEFYPDLYNTSPTHIFSFESRKGERMGHGGLALTNKEYHPENVQYHDEIVARVPDRHNIKKYFTRDPYKAYKQAKKHTFYWVVDTAVDLVEDWDFDFYPDIHSIENVFAFKSEGDGEAGVYLVHRPHLEQFNPSEEDFSFDRFKNIIRVDRVASRVIGHPAFYFDEGMYKANTEHFTEHKNIDVIDATDLAAAYRKAADMTKTGYFWALDNDAEMIDDFERSFYVDRHHKSHFHLWPKENPYTGFVHQYGGLKLIPAAAIKELKPDADKLRKMTFKNKKPVKKATAATRDIPYDVVFLSYNEPFADQNYAKLLERVPNAKRVHGVKGIFNAHKQAAELADTRMFYVVDADAILLEDFKFEYFPTVWDEDIVHTWKSKNPINDLIYGYGGLKLFPTKLLRDAQDWRIDFTTSVSEKFKPMPIAANYTAFNTDPFNTWKSAFRECTKLSSSIIHRSKQDENDERLEAWCTKGADREFGEYAIAGANAGREWGAKYSEDDEMLGKINDFAWLEEKFKEQNNGK